MNRRAAMCVAGALALTAGGSVTADTVSLGASKDNTLYEDPEGLISNGAGRRLFAGRNDLGDRRRGLVAFDVDSAEIPAGSTIANVTLRLYMSRTSAGTRVVTLRRLLADWGEGASDAPDEEGGGADAEPGDATWIHTFFPSSLWADAGGDFATGAPSASTTVDAEGSYAWSSAQMAADVQAWLDDPASNFGWIVIGDEATTRTTKRFDTRETASDSRRPRLEIEFTPPPDVGACCIDDTCQLLNAEACAKADGVFLGAGTSCDGNPCGAPAGACCFADGDCAIQKAGDCAQSGGTYQGDDTVCDPNPCPQPTGACCSSDGTCAIETRLDCEDAGGEFQGSGTTCTFDLCPVALVPFVDPLPRPAVAVPVSGEPGGEATYEIAIRQFQQQLHRDLPPTTVWGYDGTFPGPTIEAGAGLPVTVEWINDLRDEKGNLRTDHLLPVDLCPHGADTLARTVVHLHGGHVPAAFDGHPEDTILPGESHTYFYPNLQDAATLWYHDHALGTTRLNVYLGLAGFYLVRDEFEESLGLPAGEFDVPLAIQDRSVNADGSLRYPAQWQDHFFGKQILVNGKIWPYLEVGGGKYRFRILGGSGSRTYTLQLLNGAPFFLIGSDGGLLREPVEVSKVTVAPGERVDIVIDFASYQVGTEILFFNTAPAPFPGTPGVGEVPFVLKFVVVNRPGHTDPLPATLRPIEPLDEEASIIERDFVLQRADDECTGSVWLINGLHWNDITERPRLGDTEVWSFINRSGIMHPMHMHLVFFQVLDRQDFDVVDGEIVPVGERRPPAAGETGWKDTVQAAPREITRVIARFEDYTGLFPYHCHILEHEDHEMMRQFETRPACPGDVDRNDAVDFQDLIQVLDQWGPCPGCSADINGDQQVDFNDLLVVLDRWGPCPE